MTGPGDGLIWYAAYGSNLWSARFLTYLAGGPVPLSPAGRVQAGARDPSPPLADRPARLPGRVLFGRSSPGWGGGGVAFLDPAPGPAPAAASRDQVLGRLWLITADQFADVASQENGHPLPAEAAHPSALEPGGHLDVGPGWYGRLLHLGDGPDGYPILTFTCPDPAALPRRPAHPAYREVIARGLIETWGLTAAEAAGYLGASHSNHVDNDRQRRHSST
ncbi:MAG: histone deacetylase [Acidimicrobiia bacterium]|nr:histone deacetylase [Acidimicrobiia bacterium]MDH4363449.1 histone deacetylase [Acidimicrobiia bacterium]MDH5288946.1 histone deacetylase [Acidimicrobiia bacterium]